MGFVYQDIRLCRHRDGQPREIRITVAAHEGIAAKCSRCLKAAPCYDRLEQRSWLFIPLWGMVTWFLYAVRRVDCPEHGVVVEHIPWSEGKRTVTLAMIGFLSRWARRLSWRETARAFGTSWECVYRSVEWFVQWGLAHRKLEGVESIGVDEIHWGQSKGANSFLTVIYQIDRHCRRLLWVGPKRTQATLRRGLAALGPQVVGGLRFVCTDRKGQTRGWNWSCGHGDFSGGYTQGCNIPLLFFVLPEDRLQVIPTAHGVVHRSRTDRSPCVIGHPGWSAGCRLKCAGVMSFLVSQGTDHFMTSTAACLMPVSKVASFMPLLEASSAR